MLFQRCFFEGDFAKPAGLAVKLQSKKYRCGAERSGAEHFKNGAERSGATNQRREAGEAKRSEAKPDGGRSEATHARSGAKRSEGSGGGRLCLLLYITGIMCKTAVIRSFAHNCPQLCKVKRSEAERQAKPCGGNERSVAERVERSGVQKAA